LCRFLGRLHHETIHAPTTGVREGPSNEIAGRKGLGFTDANYGDLRSVSVSFQEFGTMNAQEFDGLIGRGERAPPALRSGSTRWRRSQGVGGASWRKRRRRWLTVSRVAVDNAISTMTYRSLSRGSGGRLVLRLASPRDRLDDKHAAAAAGTRVRERGWLIVAGGIILVGFVGARRIAAMPRWHRRQNQV
jgi:hypothetical protein